MQKYEMKIIAKIIHEISFYFMRHGITVFDIKTELSEEDIVFTVIAKDLAPEMVKKMKEMVNRARELEVETYGWELLGDSDEKSELDILGLLIDTLEVQRIGNQDVLTMVRTNKYKKKKV